MRRKVSYRPSQPKAAPNPSFDQAHDDGDDDDDETQDYPHLLVLWILLVKLACPKLRCATQILPQVQSRSTRHAIMGLSFKTTSAQACNNKHQTRLLVVTPCEQALYHNSD
eukprot:2606834-Amphidinium_carterae.1